MSTQRNILAAILIFGIFMLIPKYMEMVGVIPDEASNDDAGSQTVSQKEPQVDIYSAAPAVSEKKNPSFFGGFRSFNNYNPTV